MSLTEKQIGDVFAACYQQLIPLHLKLVEREHNLGGCKVDFLFQDYDQRPVAVELKAGAATGKDLFQVLQYKSLLKNSRGILAAPIISAGVEALCDHYGIETLKFDLGKISELYKQIENGPKPGQQGKEIKVPDDVVVQRPANPKKDGNVAFKVTYVDSEWNGVCSNNQYEINRKNRVWCGIQNDYDVDCQSEQWKNPDELTADSFPCYDSIALKTLSFSPGMYHHGPRKDEPIVCLQAKVGKLAFFTSVEPGQTGDQRFTFAIAKIADIRPATEPLGIERIFCDPETALILEKGNYPNFRKYYPKAWYIGLFRYLDDKTAHNILADIISPDNAYTPKQRNAATQLIKIVE